MACRDVCVQLTSKYVFDISQDPRGILKSTFRILFYCQFANYLKTERKCKNVFILIYIQMWKDKNAKIFTIRSIAKFIIWRAFKLNFYGKNNGGGAVYFFPLSKPSFDKNTKLAKGLRKFFLWLHLFFNVNLRFISCL